MADNKYTQAIDQAKKDLDQIKAKVDAINMSISNINTSILNQLKKSLGNTPQNASNQINQVTNATQRLSEELKKQKAVTRELERYKKNLNVAYQRGKMERQHAVRQAKLEAQATSSLVGAYQNLVAQQKIAKQQLQNLLAARQRDNKAIKQAEARYNSLTKRVQHATVATKQLSSVSMVGLTRGVTSLMAAFGVVGGVFLFAQVVTSVFNLTKKLQSLDYALKTVMPNARDFGRTQEFLADIADRYGASIVALTERYTKFYAAAKQSNFGLEKTEKIFRSVTKAAGVLGLKQDELNGVFLALEQMISKGKVTTEELRRQLGERLPGAFGIMAKAMGVTVSQLDVMLRKGEIMSSEALPKFADALEEAYGIEQVNRVDTLVAAQTRMNNKWVEFTRLLSGEGGGGAAISAFNFIAGAMENVNRRFENFFEVFQSGYTLWERAQIKLNGLTRMSIPLIGTYNGVFEKNTELLKDNRKFRDQVIENVKREGLAVKALYEEYIELYGSIQPLLNIKADEDGFFSVLTTPPDTTTYYADIEKQIKSLETELKSLSEVEAATQAPAIREEIEALEKRLELWDGAKKRKEEEKVVIEGSIQALEDYVAELEDERDRLATTWEERNKYNIKIDETEEKIRKLIRAYSDLEKAFVTSEGFDYTLEGTGAGVPDAEMGANGFAQWQRDDEELRAREAAKVKELEIERKMALEKGYFEYVTQLNEEILENSTSLSEDEFNQKKYWIEKELEILEDASKRRVELENDIKEGVLEIGEAFLDERIDRVDEEMAMNREKYAQELDNEELSQEQRLAIEAERDAKEAELQKKKRKREEQNFLIRKGLALAEIAINLAQTISAIKLASAQIVAAGGGTPAALAAGALYASVNTPLAIQTAAVQAGVIIGTALPQFEKGTENAPEGLAIIDEKRPEVHMDKHGNIKSFGSEGGARLTYTEKGDKIVPSHEAFFKSMGYDEMQQAIFKMNMQSNGEQLSRYKVDNILNTEMKGMRADMNKLGKEVKKLASRPISNNVNVTVKEDSAY